MRFILFSGISSLFFFFTSCSTYSEQEKEDFNQQIQQYVDSLHLKMERTEDGLYYQILQPGEGEFIRYNDKITFYYTGSFLDGNVFQNISEKEAISYKVNQLIIGWQDALMMLKEGGKIHIIIPPHLGYAKQTTEKIPPSSIIQYELTVLNIE